MRKNEDLIKQIEALFDNDPEGYAECLDSISIRDIDTLKSIFSNKESFEKLTIKELFDIKCDICAYFETEIDATLIDIEALKSDEKKRLACNRTYKTIKLYEKWLDMIARTLLKQDITWLSDDDIKRRSENMKEVRKLKNKQ